MAINGGDIKFSAYVDTDGIKKDMTSLSNTVTKSFKKLGIVIAAAFSVKALVNFGASAIQVASDLQEVQNVVDTAFGDTAYKCEEFANTAIEQFGMSELSAKQTASTYMAMAKSLGLSADEASNMAIDLAGLTGDMASFYNVEQDIADTALKSVFTGETESLKQFGVVMTEANLSAFALTQGITKQLSAMSQAEKTQLRYAYVTQQLSLAQGDFAKTSNSWANQTRILSEQWNSFKGTIGAILMETLSPLLQMLNQLMSAAIQFGNALKSAFGIADESATTTISNVGSVADQTIASTEEVLDTSESAQERSLASFDTLNVLSGSPSSGGGQSAGGSPADSGASLVKTTSTAKKQTSEISSAIDHLIKKFQTFGKKLKDLFTPALNEWKKIFSGLGDIASGTFDGIVNTFSSLGGAIGAALSGLVTVFAKSFQTVSAGTAKWITSSKNTIIKGVNNITGNLTSGFNSLKTFFSSIATTASGSLDRMRGTVSTGISTMLTGFTNFGLTIGTIASSAFSVWSQNLATWATDNAVKIGSVFDSFQQLGANIMTVVGNIFSSIASSLTVWWEEQMKPVWDQLTQAVLGIAGTVMNVWLEWIYPVIEMVIEWVQKMWDEHLKGVFNSILSFVAKVGDFVSSLWNNILKPVVDWIIKTVKPIIMNVVDIILDVVESVWGAICDVVDGILQALGGLLDFFTGIFTLDFEKAWNGIKDIFEGVWNAIWGIVKGVVNLIIDGINALWSGLYTAFASIVNGVGGVIESVASWIGFDIDLSIPSEAPKIPKLATGAVIPPNREFMAVFGDQRSGTNLEAPEALIRKIVREESGGRGVNIHFTGTLAQFVRALNPVIKQENHKDSVFA